MKTLIVFICCVFTFAVRGGGSEPQDAFEELVRKRPRSYGGDTGSFDGNTKPCMPLSAFEACAGVGFDVPGLDSDQVNRGSYDSPPRRAYHSVAPPIFSWKKAKESDGEGEHLQSWRRCENGFFLDTSSGNDTYSPLFDGSPRTLDEIIGRAAPSFSPRTLPDKVEELFKVFPPSSEGAASSSPSHGGIPSPTTLTKGLLAGIPSSSSCSMAKGPASTTLSSLPPPHGGAGGESLGATAEEVRPSLLPTGTELQEISSHTGETGSGHFNVYSNLPCSMEMRGDSCSGGMMSPLSPGETSVISPISKPLSSSTIRLAPYTLRANENMKTFEKFWPGLSNTTRGWFIFFHDHYHLWQAPKKAARNGKGEESFGDLEIFTIKYESVSSQQFSCFQNGLKIFVNAFTIVENPLWRICLEIANTTLKLDFIDTIKHRLHKVTFMNNLLTNVNFHGPELEELDVSNNHLLTWPQIKAPKLRRITLNFTADLLRCIQEEPIAKIKIKDVLQYLRKNGWHINYPLLEEIILIGTNANKIILTGDLLEEHLRSPGTR